MSKVDYLVYVENWLCEQDMYRVCGSYPNCIRKKRDNQKIKKTDELLDDSIPRHCSLNGGQTKVCKLIKSREVPQEIVELRERLDIEYTNLNMHHENEKYLTIKKQIENNRWVLGRKTHNLVYFQNINQDIFLQKLRTNGNSKKKPNKIWGFL